MRYPVPGLLGELDTVIGQDGVDQLGNHFQEVFMCRSRDFALCHAHFGYRQVLVPSGATVFETE